jgi:hypothetical protein
VTSARAGPAQVQDAIGATEPVLVAGAHAGASGVLLQLHSGPPVASFIGGAP